MGDPMKCRVGSYPSLRVPGLAKVKQRAWMFNHIHYTRRADKQDKHWQGNQYSLENGRSGRKRILQRGDFDPWKSNGVCLACLSRHGKQATNLKLLFWEKRSSTREENWTIKLLLVSRKWLGSGPRSSRLKYVSRRKVLVDCSDICKWLKTFFDLCSLISSLV